MMSSTISINDNTVKLGITLPKSIIQKIDKKRADIPTTGGGVGMGSIQSILGNNSTAATTTYILPITSTMVNLGIPLTGSTAMGFTIGILKGQ